MARKLRWEVEGRLYHIINRGNYRGDVFRGQKTRRAFLTCLDEACTRAGWRVHAWCVMSNHYHLALETPRGNLITGMQWLQSTFAQRFNRLRREHGHLFQGRYQSLLVDPHRLGAVCHYIHLNPVRARLCPGADLAQWPWTSLTWLNAPSMRPPWYEPGSALAHAGQLADTAAGHKKYGHYLQWLGTDAPAQKELAFAEMCQGWMLGTAGFKQEVLQEAGAIRPGLMKSSPELREATEGLWREQLDRELKSLGKNRRALAAAGKSADWKLALGAHLKRRTTATNRWLAANLGLGHPDEASRKISTWNRTQPSPNTTPNPKA